MRALLVGVAGFCGAISRYWLDGVVTRFAGGGFPWGTLVVNVSGCFLVGLLTTVFTERIAPHPAARIAVTIGFVGAYTTFSTFAYESLRQLQEGAVGLAVVNVAVSVVTGIFAAWVGVMAGRVV